MCTWWTSAPSAFCTDTIPRGRTRYPSVGNTAYAAVSSSGVTRPLPSASDGTSGWSRDAKIARQTQHRPAAHLLLQQDRRGVARLEQRRAERHLVAPGRALVARNPHAAAAPRPPLAAAR